MDQNKKLVKNEVLGYKSIRQKLILLLIALVVLPSVFLGFRNYQTSTQILTKELKNTAESSTTNLQNTFDIFTRLNEENVQLLANNLNLKEILTVNSSNMRYLVNVLQDYKDKHSDVQNVYIGTTTKQFYVYPQAQLPPDFDPTSRPWYKEATSQNKVIWTEPYVDTATKKLVVTVAAPVYDANNQVVGVAGIDIDLSVLTKLVSSVKLGEKGYFILTNKDGIALSHPDSSQIGKEIPVAELKQAVLSGNSGQLDYTYNKDKKMAVYKGVSATGWKLIGNVSYSEIHNNSSLFLNSSLINGLISCIIAILIGLLVSRPITNALKMLVEEVVQIGNGNFTVKSKVKSKDEIGVLANQINKMVEDLGDLFGKIKNTISEVTDSAGKLASSSEETSTAADEITRTITEISNSALLQAESTEQGLDKTTELSDSIQSVSSAIVSMTNTFENVKKLNSNGLNTIGILMGKASENSTASNKVKEVILKVDNSSQEIGIIIDTIGSIAEQTNLLALNASIEAARAGEAGRGFSVVAEEIRKLAEQSADATNKIRDLILGIQNQSKDAVSEMHNAEKVISEQTSTVDETRNIFHEISGIIDGLALEVIKVNELNKGMVGRKDEILKVMEAVSSAAEETSAAVQEISASTEQQLATIEEVATMAESLNQLANNLNEEIKRFQI